MCIYFLLLRLQTRSTLFPYTTLFRSVSIRPEGLRPVMCVTSSGDRSSIGTADPACSDQSMLLTGRRSEEHTSELQSRVDLVCRLLLEKKKTQCHSTII